MALTPEEEATRKSFKELLNETLDERETARATAAATKAEEDAKTAKPAGGILGALFK